MPPEIPEREIEIAMRMVLKETRRCETLSRGTRPFLPLKEKIIVITDDGIASGHSTLAAATFVRKRSALALFEVGTCPSNFVISDQSVTPH
jgi:predicted phosphoribosyltransferase